MSDPVRLSVVTGFLGAGKSTWLQHQLRSGVFAGARLVVNEAASAPVDQKIPGGGTPPVVLAGGCACCARRREFIDLLRQLACPADVSVPPTRIVFETSGLADPAAIVAAIRDAPGLAARLVVSEIVTLVGAPQGLETLDRQALARRQVVAADCLIVTKLDRVDAATATRLASRLAHMNPTAPIFGADRGIEMPVQCESIETTADLPAVLPLDDAGLPPHTVDLDVGAVDWSRFGLWLSALLHARGSDILRVEGVVPTPRGRLLLQGIGGVLDPPLILPGPAQSSDGTLVITGRGFSASDLRRSLRSFARACDPAILGLYSADGGA